MLRIIAGKYRGRKITTGKHLAARPTMSVVREAIFSILSSRKPIYSSSHNNPNKVRYGFMVVGFVCQQRIVMT